MSLEKELETLSGWIQRIPRVGIETLGGAGASMHLLDFVMIGVLKRTLSLASGVHAMILARNMTCARALLRMQLDTVTRLLAYTYVTDPESVANGVISGEQLKKYKSSDGRLLTDSYLVDRMSQDHPWVQKVYGFTSGYVHFSERQFFDSIHSLSDDSERNVTFQVSHIDSKFPEDSWKEVAACFNHLTEILTAVLRRYGAYKNQANKTMGPPR